MWLEDSANIPCSLLPALPPQPEVTHFSSSLMNFECLLPSFSGFSKERRPSFWQYVLQKRDVPGEQSLCW